MQSRSARCCIYNPLVTDTISPCAKSPTSSATCSRTGRLRETRWPYSPTRTAWTPPRCRRWQRDEPLRELVRLAPDECRGGRRDPHLHADDGASVRGSPDAGDRVRPRRQRGAEVDPPRDSPRRRGGPPDRGVGTAHIRMDDAAVAPNGPYPEAAALLAALGASTSTLPVELYDNGPHYVYVGLETRDEVAALRPDLSRLAALGTTAFCVFAGEGPAWKCRVFAPGEGIAEDPATGAAAGPLAVHLARHGRIAFGDEIVIEQGVEIGRPSTLCARLGRRDSSSTASRSAGKPSSWDRERSGCPK